VDRESLGELDLLTPGVIIWRLIACEPPDITLKPARITFPKPTLLLHDALAEPLSLRHADV
jgi:hypothetical protein